MLRTRLMALLLALSAPLAAQDDNKKKEEEAKAKLAEFKKELRAAKTDTEVARAIQTLGDLQHPKVLAELKVWLSKPSTEIAIAAAEQIGRYKKEKEAAETLVTAAGARRDKDTIIKCLRYAGDVGFKGISSKLIGYMSNKEADVAAEAVDSLGKLKVKDAIDKLINLARELEAIRDDAGTAGGVGAVGAPALPGGGVAGANTALDRKKKVLPAVYNSLGTITNERHSTLKDWEAWWRKNRSTFKELE